MFKNLFFTYDKLFNLNNIDLGNIGDLKEIISKKINIDKKEFYLICNNKLLVSVDKLQDGDNITVMRKIKGGVLYFAGQIAAVVAIIVVLIILMKPLLDIIKIMIMIISVIGQILALFPAVVETIILVFNPKRLIDDVIFASTFTIKKVVGGMISSVDSGTSKNPEEDDPEDIPKVCVSPSLFNLFILLICPPLALFINLSFNFQGFFLVVVCAILTVWCYYFPGLIFAALHIFC